MHDPLPYAPFDGRPLRMSLGLRRLDLAQWLQVDDDYAADLARKRDLLATRHHEVVAVLPAGGPGAQETLELVVGWLATHHPELVTDTSPNLHPVDAAGRLLQEDLCVLTRDEQAWRLSAASVCFPSRWRLADKIGATVAQIHEPVPGYESISDVVDRSLDRLDVSRPLWRLNWSLLDDPELFQPGPASGAVGLPTSLDDVTVRVERQTLRRLPRTGAVLFTIRTYRAALCAVVDEPGVAAALASTLRQCPPELAAYKGWSTMLHWLVDTLDAVSAEPASRG